MIWESCTILKEDLANAKDILDLYRKSGIPVLNDNLTHLIMNPNYLVETEVFDDKIIYRWVEKRLYSSE